MGIEMNQPEHGQGHGRGMSYWRFAATIATAVVLVHAIMYIDTYALDHLRWSESRMYMAITMGGVMTFVMLGWIWNMYQNRRVNAAIVGAAILVLAGSITLDAARPPSRTPPS